MSKLKFDPNLPSIILDADIKTSVTTEAKLILDTGSSYVTLPSELVQSINILVNHKDTVHLTSASSREKVIKIIIPEMVVLGNKVKKVEAIVKDLPPEAPADGLLGLSFLKHFKLTVDFKKGILELV